MATDDADGTHVRFFVGDSQRWVEDSELRHDFMSAAACIEWAPLGEVIAVGCAHGVCVWMLLPEGNNWCAFMQHPAGAPVVCLTWSPTARFLATASPGHAEVCSETLVPSNHFMVSF